jgi:carboxylesterase type B
LEIYNPSVIVARGNVIFVAMQYRLGAFGFLSMGTNSTAPGNAGLLDQVM